MTDPALLNVSNEFRTSRLHMRIPRPGDGEALYEAVSESLELLREFPASMPWALADPSVSISELFCRTAASNFIVRREFSFLILASDEKILGCVGLHHLAWSVPKCEIGFWGRAGTRGQGFVQEAVGGALRYALDCLHMQRVELITDQQNTKAVRVAQANSFQLEGTLRAERRSPFGDLRNTLVYAAYGQEAQSQ
jgi:RimJ/RimL family protein N-acetyltransferase